MHVCASVCGCLLVCAFACAWSCVCVGEIMDKAGRGRRGGFWVVHQGMQNPGDLTLSSSASLCPRVSWTEPSEPNPTATPGHLTVSTRLAGIKSITVMEP